MNQMLKKIIVCGSLVLSFIVSTASAALVAEPTLEIEDQLLTVEGSLSEAKPYANVSVEVYYPEYGPEDVDVSAEDYVSQMKKAIFWMGQVNTGKDLTYTLNLDMNDAEPGEYLVRVFAQGAQNPVEASIYYSSPKQQMWLIEQVTKATTALEIEEILDIASEESITVRTFRLTDPLYFSADPGNTAALLYDYNQQSPIDVEDSERFKEILLLCSVADNLTQGNRFDIMKYSNLFTPDEDFADTYDDRLKDSAKEAFTEGFKGAELKNESDIQDEFARQVFLSVINNIQNWADIKYVIETHGDDKRIDLDMDYYEDCKDKEKLVVELAKDAPYSSIEDFNDNLVKEAKKIKAASSKDSGSSGGGGGGGGGGGRVSITTPPALPEIPADEFVPEEPQKPSFKDLDSALWAKESIEYLAEKGIVSGVNADIFEPDREITREEFIKMLVCAFDKVSSDATCSFTDVDKDSWYYSYAATAEKLGVLKGYDDGRMGVGDLLSREDIAALSYRMAVEKGIDLTEVSADVFPDDSLIAPYAHKAVYAMKNAGIINGMGDGSFAPKDHCTRAQAARIIYGLIKLVGDK